MNGEWGLWSVHNGFFLCCSSVVTLSPFYMSPSHEMLSFPSRSCTGFPQAAVVQVLLQHGSLSQGLPFSTTVLHTGPHRWQLLQPCSAMGSSPGATAPAPGCSHGGLSMDCTSSRAHQLLHQVCSCRWRCTVPMDSRGNGLLTMGLSWAVRSFCCVPLSPPAPLSALTLVPAGFVSLTFLTPLFQLHSSFPLF